MVGTLADMSDVWGTLCGGASMATAAKKRVVPVPPVGTYLTDMDAQNLYRVEAIHRREGIVLEDCRSLANFMLTIKEFQKQKFQEISAWTSP